ncbi:MAG: hypothetical protein QXU99_00160 [Candidatus Bathyarchaeia archaeon]
MNPLKTNSTTLLLATLLILSLTNIASAIPGPTPSPSPLTEQEKILCDKALKFLTEVFGFDTASYHSEVIVKEYPIGSIFDKTLKFNFTSAESKVEALILVRGDSLYWCTLRSIKGSPVFMAKSSDVLVTATDTLDRLQAFSAKDYLPTFRRMLDSVTELANSKITAHNFTQEIVVSGSTVRISWEPFANGLSNQQNKLYLEFQNGNLMFFADYLGTYNIGSAEIKISEQEAIKIAIEHVRAYSYVQGNETVSNITVLDNLVIANISLQNRGNNTLYPLWDIRLPLDKVYPGGVTAFHVSIWADTGEVSYITPIGYGGDPNATPSESQAAPDYSPAIATALLAATATVVVIAATILFIKKEANSALAPSLFLFCKVQ